MSSRRQYSSGGCSYDIPSPRRCLPRIYNRTASSGQHNPYGQHVAAISTSEPTSRYIIHFSTQGKNHLCVNKNSTTRHHQRIRQIQSQLTVRLRTITWLPRKKEIHHQRSVLHIFIPTAQKTPVLRQESWTQILYTDDLITAVNCDIRYFADDILIFGRIAKRQPTHSVQIQANESSESNLRDEPLVA